MPANYDLDATELTDRVVGWLGDRLPPGWTATRTRLAGPGDPATRDATIDIRGPDGTYAAIFVEAKRSFGPRDAQRLLAGLTRSLLERLGGTAAVLVAAPWLSRRTQELLAAQEVNYVDLTGNARIALSNPALFVSTEGAARNPEPMPRKPASLRGPKAARLIRLLGDVRPPYGVREIADAASLTPGYVSRLLDSLDRDAVIERAARGRVSSVDVAALLRRWADSYEVLRTNDARAYVAPDGPRAAAAQLAALGAQPAIAVTGSFAANRLAPVAAPALFLAYCSDPAAAAEALGLLPADTGANALLLRPFDPVVWERTSESEGVRYAAPSQVAVDCLTGNGRMPAEGEAVLTWMLEDESRWRSDSLAEAKEPSLD